MVAPVFFILGGPGTGKGTNCERLVQDFGFKHFSAGDLLREEGKKESELGEKIRKILAEGNIVPSEVTVSLLHKAINEAGDATGFLVDGFPRKLDQAQMFEDGIAKARGILYFDCSMEVMEKRIKARAEAGSGRTDDNAEAVRKRFQVNVEQCMPVVEKYQQETPKRCYVIDANRERDEVYADVKKIFVEEFGCRPKQ
jgi:adenylate kinase family enzyme